MGEPGAWPPWAFPLLFVALWVGIFALISRWGGWHRLAESYPALDLATGQRFRMRSARLRAGCNYNNCLTFVSSVGGLGLSMPLPFRFQHPPIFIPWNEIRVRQGRSGLFPIVVLETARCPAVPISLHRRLARRLLTEHSHQLAAGGELLTDDVRA